MICKPCIVLKFSFRKRRWHSCVFLEKSCFDPKAFCLDSRFVFVLAWFPTMGTQVHVFKLVAWNFQILWCQVVIEHSYSSCFHTHVLHIQQQRETQSFPTSFPCMWPSGTHLGLDLVGAQYVFPKSFACMWDLFWGICSSTLCHVIVGLGPCLTPTFEELSEWYFK